LETTLFDSRSEWKKFANQPAAFVADRDDHAAGKSIGGILIEGRFFGI
jgi:hypothetical protein